MSNSICRNGADLKGNLLTIHSRLFIIPKKRNFGQPTRHMHITRANNRTTLDQKFGQYKTEIASLSRVTVVVGIHHVAIIFVEPRSGRLRHK